jgi:ApaG protein
MKLVRSQLEIYDSDGSFSELQSDGVTGVQPTIEAGGHYQCVEDCQLHFDIGKIRGSYLMDNIENGHQYKIFIPEFDLVAPFRNN